jgi:2-(1,2-epoxy-1,2-dihydrophenyl)acetyl-CoA isomerase
MQRVAESPVLLDVAGGVASLTLNRPDKLNAFTAAMHEQLAAALARIEGDRGVRAVLLTGAGRAFCAGQDLSERAMGGEAVDLGETLERLYNPLIARLVALDRPVVAAVNGVAAGAGANLALACDLVLAARSATFIQAFARIGLVPDSGGTWHLPRLAGTARALGMALTGEPVSAEQALAWGLIWRVVDDERLLPEARALAERLAAGPTLALGLIKRAIRGASRTTLEEQLAIERDLQRTAGASRDYREGVAAFLEKRPPHFEGR